MVHCIVAQDVPTNMVGHLLTWWGLGPTRPTRRYATGHVDVNFRWEDNAAQDDS